MIYEFDPKKERFAVEIGVPDKLERLDKIPRPRADETVGMCINWNVFDWVKSFDGYGEIEQDGKQYKPLIDAFPSMSFKDGKLVYGDLPAAQVGVGIAITLILDGKIDIRNKAKMATGKNTRTACGQKANGNIIFVTVDNMTTRELAAYMLKQGCVTAFQGDSGGSTGYYDGTLHDQGRAVAAALVAYRKKAVVMSKLIAIDDGHGMTTAGKRTPIFPPGSEMAGRFMHENEFNRVVAEYLKANLERCGFRTLMVAPGDTDVPLQARTDAANKANADFYISVHANALTGVWGVQEGVSTYHYPGSEKGHTAAVIIQRQLAKGTKQKDRGVLEAEFYVLKYTKMPAVLCECAFMDNLREATLLISDAFRRECAEEIAKGTCEYFGVQYVPEQTDEYTAALQTVAAFAGIDLDYWQNRRNIDQYFGDLMIKIAGAVKGGK